MFYYPREDDRLATPQEAVQEFARNAGWERPDQAWLLHDWDVWVANPHYRGPKVRHPEDDGDLYEDEATAAFGPLVHLAQRDLGWDDIPF